MSKSDHKILKQIVRGAGIIFLGTFFAYFANFLYKLIIARYLGPADYGLISLGQTILNFALVLAVCGLNSGVIHYVAYFRGQKAFAKVKGTFYSALKISMFAGILLSVLLIILSGFISENIFHTPKFQPILIVFALVLPFHVFLRLLGALFLALKKAEYRELTRTVAKNVLNLVLVSILIFFGRGVFDISLAFLVAVFASALLGFLLYRYKLFPKFFAKKKLPVYNYRMLLSFSVPLLFVGFFFNMVGWSDNFFIGYFGSPADVGVYNAAFLLAAAMGMFMSSFGLIFYPISSELLARKKNVKISKTFNAILRWIFLVLLPIFLLLLFFPRSILQILYGKEYAVAAPALMIVSCAFFFNVLTGPGIRILQSFKKIRFIFVVNLFVFLLNLFLNLILIPLWGIIGAAIATAISMILRELILFLKAKSLINFSFQYLVYVKCILSGLISLGLLLHFSDLFKKPYSLIEFLLFLLFFGCVYLFILIIFKFFNKHDILILSAIKRKLGLNSTFLNKFINKFL